VGSGNGVKWAFAPEHPDSPELVGQICTCFSCVVWLNVVDMKLGNINTSTKNIRQDFVSKPQLVKFRHELAVPLRDSLFRYA